MPLNIARTLLLIIDVQNDFCPAYTCASGQEFPGGTLAVEDGGGVVAPLNTLAAAITASGGWVAATQDWHPEGHISFKKPEDSTGLGSAPGQILWPEHCVQGGQGAAFHADLDLKPVNLIIRKGFRKELDSYSAFFENDRVTPTGLEGWARGLGIETIIIGGLATDYCVLYSALDSQALGFRTIIADDAIRGVGYPSGSVEKAIAQMRAAGNSSSRIRIAFTASWELLEDFN